MKLQKNITQKVAVTVEEAQTLLTKLVEKKTGKKVETVVFENNGWIFSLPAETEENDLDTPKAQ